MQRRLALVLYTIEGKIIADNAAPQLPYNRHRLGFAHLNKFLRTSYSNLAADLVHHSSLLRRGRGRTVARVA